MLESFVDREKQIGHTDTGPTKEFLRVVAQGLPGFAWRTGS